MPRLDELTISTRVRRALWVFLALILFSVFAVLLYGAPQFSAGYTIPKAIELAGWGGFVGWVIASATWAPKTTDLLFNGLLGMIVLGSVVAVIVGSHFNMAFLALSWAVAAVVLCVRAYRHELRRLDKDAAA